MLNKNKEEANKHWQIKNLKIENIRNMGIDCKNQVIKYKIQNIKFQISNTKYQILNFLERRNQRKRKTRK